MIQSKLFIGLTMITLPIIFSACSGPTEKDKADSAIDTVNEQTSKSAEDSKNRSVYNTLTGDLIDKTPNDQLVQIVFDNISKKLPQDYRKEYETVLTFTKAQQVIYVIGCLEGEVNNGGFNQLYFNSTGQFAKLMPDALQLVGAAKFADLVRQANKIYETENKKITKNQDGTLEGFSKSYDDNPLNEFDSKFYNLEKIEDLQKLHVDFIRKNKTDFIDK